MLEQLNKEEALAYVLDKMNKEKAYEGVEQKELTALTKKIMEADFAYMVQAKVEEGGVYDEDEAYDYIVNTLSAGLDEENRALISLITDGYLEYFDAYLDEHQMIEWA